LLNIRDGQLRSFADDVERRRVAEIVTRLRREFPTTSSETDLEELARSCRRLGRIAKIDDPESDYRLARLSLLPPRPMAEHLFERALVSVLTNMEHSAQARLSFIEHNLFNAPSATLRDVKR